MDIGFLIESDIWEENEDRILETLSKKDIPFATHPCEDFDPSILHKLDAPQIFCYGSLQWIAQVQAVNDPRLVTMCSMPNFDCQIYYPFFRDFLFNNTHQMMTLDAFVSNFDQLLEQYGGKLFMRPCTGFKNGSVSGGMFDRVLFDEYIGFFQEALKPDDMLVVDQIRSIDYEWRTIICNSKCLTGSQYGSIDPETQRFGFDPSPNFPDRVRAKADEIVQSIEWAPDSMFVLDIVESDNTLSVMEINALSTSGWYDCDIGIIVDAICDQT